MRRYWVLALAVLTLLGVLSPPAFAQAPTPKVTITGLIDFVTAWTKNIQDSDAATKETEWYSRQRARLDFIGELGKAKMVWGIELDFANGNLAAGRVATSGGLDISTDVIGAVETKWLYVEFPFTGKGSLLPFIDVPTTARGGGQPSAGHEYKVNTVLGDDFAGLRLITIPAPGVKNTFSFVQIDECTFRDAVGSPRAAGESGGCPGAAQDSYALVDSLEFSPWKGLTLNPIFAYANYAGANTGTASLGTPARGGFLQGTRNLWRATVGGDLRWVQGPWFLEPTFYYHFGTQDLLRADTVSGVRDVDISAYYADVIGGWRQGPLNLEARFVYTPGMEADECVQRVASCSEANTIRYYTQINGVFPYFGWSEIWVPGTDYLSEFRLRNGSTALYRPSGLGYDKYGLIFAAVRATYAVTPALSLLGVVSGSWTEEKVDTNSAFSTTTGLTPFNKAGETQAKGDARYLGTELVLGFTWRFAPGLTFDGRYAHLFAGGALDQCVPGTGGCQTPRDAKDMDYLVARVRYTF